MGGWVFCSGMMRSGSTVQYQIAKALVEAAGRGIGVGSCRPGRFDELLAEHDDPGRTYVVKTHRYLATASRRLRRGEARSVYVYRDLRDVVVSRMHKEQETFREVMDAGFVDRLLEDDASWATLPNTLVSVYEELIADLRAEVGRIAKFLGIEAAGAELDRLAEEYSLDRQKRRLERLDFGRSGVGEGRTNLVDPETQLHHNHVRSGATRQWAEELTPEQVAELESVAGAWLVERGYELSDGGAPADAAVRHLRRVRRRARAERRRADRGHRLGPWVDAAKAALLRPVRWARDAVTSVGLTRAVGEPLYRISGRRPAPGAPTLDGVRRVLVVRVDEIGDVVLTGPLLRELRRDLPDAEITLAVKPGVAGLVEHCPYVDRVLTYDWSSSGLFRRPRRQLRALRLARRELWRPRLDLALLPRWGVDRYDGAFLAYYSGAAVRLGQPKTGGGPRWRSDADFDRLLTHVVEADGPKHEVERNLDLLRHLGGEVRHTALELWLGEGDAEEAAALLGPDVDGDEPLVAFGIGAAYQRRVWPIPRYAAAAEWVRERFGARVVLLGGGSDRALGESVARQTGAGVIDLTGRTTLRQASALLERCELYVGNDTGIMHLAAAVGTPVVMVSCHPRTGDPDHANSPVRFHPWGVEHRVLRPERPREPCADGCTGRVAHCITRIPVERVLEAARELLLARAETRGRVAQRAR